MRRRNRRGSDVRGGRDSVGGGCLDHWKRRSWSWRGVVAGVVVGWMKMKMKVFYRDCYCWYFCW